MKILIAEDDAVLARCLAESLRVEGYAVDIVSDGSQANTALTLQAPDLLILDIGLPSVTGLDVLKGLRRRGSAIPVLLISAAGSPEDQATGLDLGADDYMPKPFAVRELQARVRAMLRRGRRAENHLFRQGMITYDFVGRTAFSCDSPIQLSSRETIVLEYFLTRPGRIVPKDHLMECLRDLGYEVSPNAIEVYVHRLRSKLHTGGVSISTVRGLGYCFRENDGVCDSSAV